MDRCLDYGAAHRLLQQTFDQLIVAERVITPAAQTFTKAQRVASVVGG